VSTFVLCLVVVGAVAGFTAALALAVAHPIGLAVLAGAVVVAVWPALDRFDTRERNLHR
jgi:hypothetical protein